MAEMNEMNEMNEVNEVNIQDVVPVLTKPKRTQTPEMKAKKSKKDSEVKEPRAPTPWGNFTQRVRLVLKENGLSPKGLETQFCSMLATPKDGKTKNYDWSDEAILEARKGWVEPAKKANKEKKMAKAKEEEFDANTQNVLDLCNGMKSYLSLLYDGGKAEGTDDTYKEFDAFFAKKIKSITK